MHLIFADDSKQNNATRPGVGPLVAAGAVMIDADVARSAEKALDALCAATGFPPGEEFKWSPGRACWMRTALVAEARDAFFRRVIDVLLAHGVLAHVVIEDANRGRATRWDRSAEDDVVIMLLERLANRLKELRSTALLVADRPGGNRSEEDRFIADCLQRARDWHRVRPARGVVLHPLNRLQVRAVAAGRGPRHLMHDFVRCR